MKIKLFFAIACLSSLLSSCEVASSGISSPNENISLQFQLSQNDGSFYYTIQRKGTTVIDTSYIGFDFKNAPSLDKGFKAIVKSPNEVNETWQMPWGE